MYLKEFDLDLLYVEDEERIKSIMEECGCTRAEAIKLDYEQRWKQKAFQFSLETRCVCSMFDRLFGKMKDGECWKVMVLCMENVDDERVITSDLCYAKVKFDYDTFAASDDYRKKQLALSALMEGIKIIVTVTGWDLALFEAVNEKIIEADYKNEWVWKKATHKSRKFSAELLLQHEVKQIDISIVLRDKSGTELAREKIITERPDEWFYVKYLGKFTWISETEVALTNKEGDKTWAVDFERFIKH